jgi:CRISPR/Cas system CMR subunit Cmr4 (Cas7 group RAMP superfamily)
MAPPTALTFTLTTYTPFRVATGSAGAGADAVVDRQVPLPGSTIKGLMRDAARSVLGGTLPDHPLIVEVFGSEQPPGGDAGSPWHWEDVSLPTASLDIQSRSRLRINPGTGAAETGALLVGEEVSPTLGTIEVWNSGAVQPDRLAVHTALLLVSAGLVVGLGSDRRAGHGWVRLLPSDGAMGRTGWAAQLHLLRAARQPPEPAGPNERSSS